MAEPVDPTRLANWPALLAQSARLPSLRELIDADDRRLQHHGIEAPWMLVDTSRQRWHGEIREALTGLAGQAGLDAARQQLFEPNHLNPTEQRAVLHTLLRAAPGTSLQLDGVDAGGAVADALRRMADFTAAVRNGNWRGMTGAAITDVVNIGIGGSFLGPALLCDALPDAGRGPRVHFLSNIDGAEADHLLARLRPEQTLFIVASKSFGTMETRINARTARRWLLERGASSEDLARHFVAITSNADAAAAFGIPPAQQFPLWDWVGGRFSVWSPIGLPVALRHGFAAFEALLAGARAMDDHFRTAALQDNAPLQLALAGIWNQNILGTHSHAVLPYASALARLPDYLQQLEMESNGKRVDSAGDAVAVPTGTVLWGGVGSNGQHAFHQLLHQGTEAFSVDFVLARDPGHDLAEHHRWLTAHCLAQAEALARGRNHTEVVEDLVAAGMQRAQAEDEAPHRVLPGNHASTLLLLDDLGPASLGALLALYEHKVFCQGIIWGINSFDQWGVEQGKRLGDALHDALTSAGSEAGDAVTRALLARLRG